eukprot:5026241-Pyramimonas_sp.AAC.1
MLVLGLPLLRDIVVPLSIRKIWILPFKISLNTSWAEGSTEGQANDALSGVQHLLRTRWQCPGARRLLSVQGRLELPQRAPPMPPL